MGRRWQGVLRVLAGAALASAFLLAGCDKPRQAPQAEVRPVKTVVAHYQPVDSLARLVGEVRPHVESDIGFQVGGRLLTREVRLGEVVRRGQVLATLDPRDVQNQLHVSEANLASARATLLQAAAEDRRQSTLFRSGWASQAARDVARQAHQSAEAAVAAALAQLRLAHDQLGYATLRAPEDGAITALGADVGQVLSAGQMAVRLARLDQRDAVFSVAESAIATVKLGQTVEVSLLDAPEVHLAAAVSEISPVADTTTRTYTVKAALPEGTESMRYGMSVVGRFPGDDRRAVALPGLALAQSEGRPAVWVFDPAQQSVALHPVTLLRVEAARVLVAGGLDEGARVVVAGVQTLRPGQKVRLMESAAP